MSIKRFPTTCFVLISLLIISCSCAKRIVQDESVSDNKPLITVIPFPDSSAVKLKTIISFENAQLSGITIVKLKGNTVTGAFINEFGLTAFEFVVCNGDCKIRNLINQLDKWYIKKTLSDDYAFIFTALYHTAKSDTVVKTYNKQEYNYYFKNKSTLEHMERYKKGVLTASLLIDNDSSFTMTNIKRNITYRMNILTYK